MSLGGLEHECQHPAEKFKAQIPYNYACFCLREKLAFSFYVSMIFHKVCQNGEIQTFMSYEKSVCRKNALRQIRYGNNIKLRTVYFLREVGGRLSHERSRNPVINQAVHISQRCTLLPCRMSNVDHMVTLRSRRSPFNKLADWLWQVSFLTILVNRP